MSTEQRDIFSVSRLNREVKQTLLNRFKPLWIQGEVSNLAKPPSGHIYFSLKDDQAQVGCAMFRSQNRMLSFDLSNGMLVLVHARVDLYAARGEFQIIIDLLEMSGTGDLKKQFEALKKRLAKEGLFDSERKRPIPAFPKSVGVITAAKSAALADILKIYHQRSSPCKTIIYATPVQGQAATATICDTLRIINQRKEVDVLIVARGGGSFEDLQVFNDERVVRSIANSEIPTVSGIGHDIDFTLTDFAADLRTPTPTAAAVHVYPDGIFLMHRFGTLQRHLTRNMTRQLHTHHSKMMLYKAQFAQFHPQTRILHRMQRLDEVSGKLIAEMRNYCNTRKINLLKLLQKYECCIPLMNIKNLQFDTERKSRRLHTAIHNRLMRYVHILERKKIKLDTISPYATLKRGYSITTDDNGKVIRTVRQINAGASIRVQVEKGMIMAIVRNITERKKNT